MPVSRVAKQRSANPFDSDSEPEMNPKPGRSSSGPVIASAAARNRYKNAFHDAGGLENQSVQELENYAAYKAEETTHKVNDCLKIAEVIREDASNTLVMLHQQGEQITRTHETTVSIDHDLCRGEKLLGSLGGFFSKPWKPKKTHQIKGPVFTTDDSYERKANHMDQREKLGLSSNTHGQSNPRHYSEPTSAMDKVQIEKAKQDDTLSDLSDVLGQLKGMALDMGTEMDRQNKALDALHEDMEELNSRVKGANQRTRQLLGK
ncbi:SNARE domain [Musa troglodytarum]|uniref:SNARE domain n=1 Tax=Musa troglodytarum TaxID=320322 RepID=A0A9E7JCB5_9LILI|nr:SNARE domain [Musa troglodytarum]